MRLSIVCVLAGLCVSQMAWAADGADSDDEPVQEEAAPAKAPVKAPKKTEKKTDKKAEKKTEGKKADEKKDTKPDEAKDAKAEPLNLTCPESIKVEAQKADKKSVPAGFSTFDENVTYWLDTVSVYSGDKPTMMETYKSTANSSTWMLIGNGKTHYYLGCGYRDTSVMLKMPLPANLTTCHVLPEENPQNPHGPQVLQQFGCE